MNSIAKGTRGALIVLEGCDRSGKTTQSKKLVEFLLSKNIPSKYVNFPARDTPTGKLLDSYLSSKSELDDHVVHLLFSANRWEAQNKIYDLLKDGVTLIVDRYSYSGVAFSAAKGMDIEWCRAPEKGLPSPDLVLLLTLTTQAIAKRGGFGNERYELPEIQAKVINNYKTLKESDIAKWIEVDADKTQEELQLALQPLVLAAINSAQDSKIKKLWM